MAPIPTEHDVSPNPDLTLAAFLLARLDEEEQAARAAIAPGPTGRWVPHVGRNIGVVCTEGSGQRVASVSRAAQVEHIARHDPSTVLADVAARRLIVAPHVELHRCEWGDYAGGEAGECTAQVLRLLAVRYAGHRDHYSGWGPR